MRKFIGQFLGGKLEFGEGRERLMKFMEKNDRLRFELVPLLPESRQQRKFYHAAVLALWAYCDGKDYKDDEVLAQMHDVAKMEFNPEIINVNGKVYKIGKTTKGKLRDGFIDKIIDYLEENYGIDRMKVLNPKDYEYFRDAIFPTSHYETYIDYLVDTKKLYDRNTKTGQ